MYASNTKMEKQTNGSENIQRSKTSWRQLKRENEAGRSDKSSAKQIYDRFSTDSNHSLDTVHRQQTEEDKGKGGENNYNLNYHCGNANWEWHHKAKFRQRWHLDHQSYRRPCMTGKARGKRRRFILMSNTKI